MSGSLNRASPTRQPPSTRPSRNTRRLARSIAPALSDHSRASFPFRTTAPLRVTSPPPSSTPSLRAVGALVTSAMILLLLGMLARGLGQRFQQWLGSRQSLRASTDADEQHMQPTSRLLRADEDALVGSAPSGAARDTGVLEIGQCV